MNNAIANAAINNNEDFALDADLLSLVSDILDAAAFNFAFDNAHTGALPDDSPSES